MTVRRAAAAWDPGQAEAASGRGGRGRAERSASEGSEVVRDARCAAIRCPRMFRHVCGTRRLRDCVGSLNNVPRGGAAWQPVALITRRSEVQILPAQLI